MSSTRVATAKPNHRNAGPPALQPLDVTSTSMILLAAALWGGTVVAVKYSEDTLPPIIVAAVRFALAAAFMLVWCYITGCSLRLTASQTPLALVAGLLLFIQISLFNLAILWSNASHGTLLISSFVIWVALIEHFVTKTDRLTARKLLGVAVAVAGVTLTLAQADQPNVTAVLAGMDSSTLVGDAIMLISAMVLSIKIVYTKYAVARVEPAKLIFWHHVTGTVLFTVVSTLLGETSNAISRQSLTMPVILALLYQGVLVGGLCFAIQASLLRYHSATQISVFGFATPLFGVIAAVFLRGDALSIWFVASGMCVAAGIYLVNRVPSIAYTE